MADRLVRIEDGHLVMLAVKANEKWKEVRTARAPAKQLETKA
jgi:hypothetical protein